MLAVLLLASATGVGLAAAGRLDLPLGPWTRLAVGIVCGQVLLLWVPFVLALAFDLGVQDAGLGALTMALVACAVAAYDVSRRRGAMQNGVAQLLAALTHPSNRPLVLVGGAFMALFAWLLHTHYLLPQSDGFYSAGVTWGDLPMHLALATRFAYADGLARLEHPLFLNGPLNYPFLADYEVAVLTMTGLPLRWAFIVGSLVPLAALLVLIHGAARLWVDAAGSLVSVLTLVLFLLAGGLGFGYVIGQLVEGAAPMQLFATTNATYISPHVLKSGHIGNLFVAARTAAYGMPSGLAALLLLGHAMQACSTARAPFVLAGLLAGSLPLVHAHSFLVLAGTVLCYAWLSRSLGRRWAWCMGALLVAALPQVVWLLGGGGPGFLRLVPGFLRPAPDVWQWLIDLTLGVGVWLLLVPLGWRLASARARRLTAPLLLLLPLANLVTFTPLAYENVKLLAWFDLAAAVLVAALVAHWWRGGALGTRRHVHMLFAGLAVLGCTLSGALALGHELVNRGPIASREDVRWARFVTQHTPPSAVVATAASHHDPVAMLSGRRVLVASPYMLSTHGIDVRDRALDVVKLYAGGDEAREVIARLGVTAVTVGPRERRQLPAVDEAFFAREARASYAHGAHRLYLLQR